MWSMKQIRQIQQLAHQAGLLFAEFEVWPTNHGAPEGLEL